MSTAPQQTATRDARLSVGPSGHIRKMLQARNFVATVHGQNYFIVHGSRKIQRLQHFVGPVRLEPDAPKLRGLLHAAAQPEKLPKTPAQKQNTR